MTVDKVTIAKDLWEVVKRQGIAFMMLMGVSYYLFTKVDDLEFKIEETQAQYMDCVQEQNSILIDVVTKNTEALKDLNSN